MNVEAPILSRRQSLDPGTDFVNREDKLPERVELGAPREHWNSSDIIPMTDDELVLYQHYVNVVGPILDLCNPSKQFTFTVPALAVHNIGLSKSLLAVAARHLALSKEPQVEQSDLKSPRPEYNAGNTTHMEGPLVQVAIHYYYETLHYLSKNLLYPAYSQSREIIATSLLISTYGIHPEVNTS